MASRRPKQSDIARVAKVSQPTVSIVINNRSKALQIAEETRQRVLDAVRELGYVADPAARNLAGGKNRLLGVYTFESLFPSQHHDFYHPFLLGIEDESEALGYDLVLFTSASEAGGRRSIYRDGVNRLRIADGCILLGREPNRDELARLAEEGFPFVYIGQREVPGAPISYVTADYAAGMKTIVRELARLGHRSVKFVGERVDAEAHRARERGFREALRAHGLPDTRDAVLRVAADAVDADWLDALLAAEVTAFFVEEPATAKRLLDVATHLGRAIPADCSIATLVDLSQESAPAVDWTGIRIPQVEIGHEAVTLLVRLLALTEARHEHVVLPCEFVPGGTVTRPPDPS